MKTKEVNSIRNKPELLSNINSVKGGGKNIKILVCVHKEDYARTDDIFMPVQGGKSISKLDLGFQGDDTGDNISIKNPNYAELTVLYWAWKNLKNVDYIGLNHYRRYFYFSSLLFKNQKTCSVEKFVNTKGTTFNLGKHLGKYDIILLKPVVNSPYSPSLDCMRWLSYQDYLLLKQVINISFPDYYYSFCKLMEHGNKISYDNMFITKWNIFDDYCKWLFAVLQKVEELRDFSGYPVEKSRVLACMGEFLLNVYTMKNKLKAKYYPFIFIDNNKLYEQSSLRYAINYFKYNLSFFFCRSWVWWVKDKILNK